MSATRGTACGRELPQPGAGAPGQSESADVVDCPMCGLAFTAGMTVCGACPVHAGCDLTRCPRCLYTFPRRSRLVELARRLLRRRAASRRPSEEPR